MEFVMDEIERYINIFDAVLQTVGQFALDNYEVLTRIFTRFENILHTFNYTVPIVRIIVQTVRSVIRLARFSRQLYRLILTAINGPDYNRSNLRPLQY